MLSLITVELQGQFRIHVRSVPPQHVGFGSKTALLLGVGAACNATMGSPLDDVGLGRLSGRGGASGIGVNAFGQGGIIVDVGHPRNNSAAYVPSSSIQPSKPPLVAIRLPFPQEWRVHLFLPFGHKYAGGEEVQFFERNTPIPEDDVGRVLGAVYHGVVPAFVEKNIRVLKKALKDIQDCGFKKREIQGQSAEIHRLLEYLHSQAGIASGMSSLGPLVYAIAPVDYSLSLRELGVRLEENSGAVYLGEVMGRNSGYELIESNNV